MVVTRTWVDARAIQVQEVRIEATVRSRRPIGPGSTSSVRLRDTELTGVEEVVRIASEDTRHYRTSRS